MFWMIILGIIVMLVSARLMDEEGMVGHFAMFTFAIGMALAILSAFCTKPVEADASNGYPIAGITKELSKMTSEALLTAEAAEQTETEEPESVSEQDIDLLARLITAEIGYSTAYTPEEYERACYLCGAVVVNRINSPDFSNNLYGVIYQEGQFAVTWNGLIERPYDDIAWEIAEGLLTYGVEGVPENLVWMALFPQGTTYEVINGVYFGTKD